MVNIDLSKVLPSRAYEHLAAFLPGLFFVFSLVLANPDLVARLAAKSEQSLTLGRYPTFGIALFLAFVIGSGFILVDTIIQYFLGYLYQLKMLIYRRICRWPLQQITRWLLTKPRLRRPSIGNFNVRVATIAAVGFDDWRQFQSCWYVLARSLVKLRYGIDSRDLKDDEWEVLYWNLGTVEPEEIRGLIVMIALHAVGWAGLVATRIAPILRNKYYLGFCMFLILNGLLHGYYVAMRRYDPRVAGNLTIRAVLREFPGVEKAGVPTETKHQ